VLGVVDDKNLDNILPLFPQNAAYYFCKANIPRALDERKLKDAALRFGLHGEAFNCVKEAFMGCKSMAVAGDLIFVGGSTFTVAEAL